MKPNSRETLQTNDPDAHAKNMEQQFSELAEHLREDVEKVECPKAKAMFETAAEVLTGLRTAFEHYRKGTEKAFR